MRTMEEEMRGKTAVVTGGNTGIGLGCAEVFCAAGMNVVIAARRAELGERKAREIDARGGGKCVFFQADVSVANQVKALVESAVKQFGGLDAMVNNAGYEPSHPNAADVAEDDFNAVLLTNLSGMFYGCKYAIPHLRKSKGAIVNMSSVLAYVGQEKTAAYSASKGGILSMTHTIAIEEARHGVRVNAICPGHIVTDLFVEKMSRQPDPKAYEERCNSYSWLGRGGTPEEIGKVALFLCSSWAGFITGASIMATGGLELGTMPKQYNFEAAERK